MADSLPRGKACRVTLNPRAGLLPWWQNTVAPNARGAVWNRGRPAPPERHRG